MKKIAFLLVVILAVSPEASRRTVCHSSCHSLVIPVIVEGCLERNAKNDRYDRGITRGMTSVFEGCLEPNAKNDRYYRIWGPSSPQGPPGLPRPPHHPRPAAPPSGSTAGSSGSGSPPPPLARHDGDLR